MSCPVCQLPEPRRKLLENLILHQGRKVEEIGQQFRIDYDAVTEHMSSHVKEPEPHDHNKLTEELIEGLTEMVDAARALAENESDAANFTAYGSTVKLLHTLSADHADRIRKEAEDARKAEVVIAAVTERVMKPLALDISKAVLQELQVIRKEIHKLVSDTKLVDAAFEDATRRLGPQVQSALDPKLDTLSECVTGQKPAAVKGKRGK